MICVSSSSSKRCNRSLNEDVDFKLLTFQDKGGKSTLWHSSAHILAEALEYFYPGINLAIGPPIENGFYYDVDFQDHSISEKDLEKIEKKMKEIVNRDVPATLVSLNALPISPEEFK